MTEIQENELEILKKFDEVCRNHGLCYYIAYGTCLGSLRHKGFIPWDHDIDVLMPIEDAVKLMGYQEEFGKRYFLSNRLTNEKHTSISYKVYDLQRKVVTTKRDKVYPPTYDSMDIYPLYHCPPGRVRLLLNIWRSHLYKLLVASGLPENHGKLMKILSRVMLFVFRFIDKEKTIRRLERKLAYKGEYKEVADYFGKDVTLCTAITYKKEWFAEPKEMRFEGHLFLGPTCPKKYMARRYGRDFMTPPPQSEIEGECIREFIKDEEGMDN
ncbi:MAG: LicD family protein [Ruminococcus sp.]|nr:LicD family protein [Ruminococcus sp.]